MKRVAVTPQHVYRLGYVGTDDSPAYNGDNNHMTVTATLTFEKLETVRTTMTALYAFLATKDAGHDLLDELLPICHQLNDAYMIAKEDADDEAEMVAEDAAWDAEDAADLAADDDDYTDELLDADGRVVGTRTLPHLTFRRVTR